MNLDDLQRLGALHNTSSDSNSGSSGSSGANPYGDMFSYQGVLSDHLGEGAMHNIEQTFSSWLNGAHNTNMLTFGLSSIFGAQKASLLHPIEGIGILSILDPQHAMAGISTLPSILKITGHGR